MKKLLIASAVLASSVGLAVADPVLAITPATATINCSAPQGTAQGPFTFNGAVGESFTIVNTGASPCVLGQMPGVVTPSGVGYNGAGAFGPEISALSTATFTIVAAGTFTATTIAGTGDVVTINVVLGGGGSSGKGTVVETSFDPNGGECIFNGQTRTDKYRDYRLSFWYAPGVAECTRKNYVFTDWLVAGSSPSTSAGLPPLVDKTDEFRPVWRHFVARSGDYVAKWSLSPEPPKNLQIESNSFTKTARLSWTPGAPNATASATPTVSYTVSVSAGPGQGVYQNLTALSFEVNTGCLDSSYNEWKSATASVFSVIDGVRSTAVTVDFWVCTNSVEARSIVIVGERTTVSGKPGICVEGITTGFEPGKTVIPYVRFPGGEYTQGTARPVINAIGEFEWCRKTGKKTYVYFTNDDGKVQSNRVIIAAS